MSRRGENIRKRKDGRWEGRYIHGYDRVRGTAKYASIYGKTYSEVKEKLYQAKYQTSIGQMYVDNKNKRFGEILSLWFGRISIKLKPSSIIKYQNLIDNHIVPELGHLKLRELNPDVFYDFLDEQSKTGNKKTGGPLSRSSLLTLQYILNSTVKYAASQNMMTLFSLQLLSSGNAAAPVNCLEEWEEKKIDMYLASNISNRNVGIMLSLYCGLRLGEVCGLKWSDFDLEYNLLHIQRTVQRIKTNNGKKETEIWIGTPKSKSSVRSIPLPDFLLPSIREMSKGVSPEWFVLSDASTPIDPRTYQYHFSRILKICGIKKTKYHTLRHTFATNCVALGFDIKTLSEILGHSNVSITLNKYVHPSIKQKQIQMDYWDTIKGQFYGQMPPICENKH